MAKKRFGKSVTPTRAAKDFMRAFAECRQQAEGNKARVQHFFKANQSQLNESLLEALPLIFAAGLAGKSLDERSQFADSFWFLGYSIYDFPLGNRALNLELSITAYELALQVCTREAFPEKWAGTQNNLGNVYADRIRGERAENLEQAITAYELALQIHTREAFPKDWATTQNNLGNAYRERIRGKRAENLEQAITAYELALQVCTREAFPQDWAGTQNNLGNAYANRIRGERAENLEQAITAYELALQVCTREAFPQDWATTQNNLGNAHRERIRGERAENLEQAITAYELALQVCTREAFPEQWARAQGNLADALMKRVALTGHYSDLDIAITLLQESLKVLPIGSPEFIECHYLLGNAFSQSYEYSRAPSHLEQATQAYKTALDAISPEHYDRAKIWQALPVTQSILGSRLVRDGQWQEGLQLLLNSVNQLSTGDDPLAHANALFQTGRAHEVLSDWDKARLYYRDALRLYQHLKDDLGVAQSQAGLGSVLISEGYLEQGITELIQAHNRYRLLQKPDKTAEVNNILQMAQKLLKQQAAEVYA
jgi:tetratricopeptide (TPR) repeat protein